MKQSRGFTLIELLVVIAIIGILSAIVLTNLQQSRSKARDANRVSNIRQIKYALELYYSFNNAYPQCLYKTGCTGTTYLEGSAQMPTMAKDPLGGNYQYAAFGSGTNCTAYHIGITLENKNSAALISDTDKAAASSGFCPGTTADFSGLGNSTTGGAACSGVGTAAPSGTETCYDLTQ